jgi:hypothetical protein
MADLIAALKFVESQRSDLFDLYEAGDDLAGDLLTKYEAIWSYKPSDLAAFIVAAQAYAETNTVG